MHAAAGAFAFEALRRRKGLMTILYNIIIEFDLKIQMK